MLKVETSGSVAVLTLDRPQRRNALGTELVQALDKALRDADANPAIGAAVLTGTAPSFCAGSDLKELGRLDIAGMEAHEAETAAIARRIGLLQLPVIAAVEGHALGGGFVLAISCDLVVSASDARWSLPEVPNGWLPPWGLKALTARTGPATARRLVWGFETLGGAEAVRLGVADFLAEPGESLLQALAIAQRLATLPRPAVRTTKRFFQAEIMDRAEAWDVEAGRLFAENCQHDAAQATLTRFAVKA